MRPKRVKAFAPATISNLGPGFDVLGLAIDRPGDFVIASRTRETGLTFSVRAGSVEVPTSVEENVAAHVASLMLDEFKPSFGVNMVLEKRMPVGSGLGSSAASSAAAVVAVNALLPRPLKKTELLRFAVEGERKASGSPHADNVAPSLLGGLCLIRSYDPLDVVSVPIRNTLVWVVVHPHIVVRTEDARRMLPDQVPLRSAVRQWGNVSGLTVGLMKGNARLVGMSIEDVIVEPVRATLISGFHEVKRAALDAGAYGCSISGSGPSIFAVAHSMRSAKKIGTAIMEEFTRTSGITSDVYISRVNLEGAHILKKIRR
ncbi:MAG TPA: homoserine kinase [Bacteroidota bacterium]|jgi:homoserine kinase|nr:homoserine kinase [Bacteroidota bacterium]